MSRAASLFGLALWLAACGSRSGVGQFGTDGTGEPSNQKECVSAADCETIDPCAPPQCLAENGVFRCRAVPLSCDDLNPCTLDRCEPLDGSCSHAAPSDGDRDGFIGAVEAGVACGGNDCDDENPDTYPGAGEICDGLDNDCDGGIDEGTVLASESAPIRLAPDSMYPTSHGGMAFTGEAFAAAYTEYASRQVSYLTRLALGDLRPSVGTPISNINADTFAGAVAKSERGLFTAWADARMDGNYEVYATRFSFAGNKLQADLRLTDAERNSLHPSIAVLGEEYVVAWDDRRFEDVGGPRAQLIARRVSHGGALLGNEVMLANDRVEPESPVLAASKTRIGVVFTDLVNGTAHGFFMLLDSNLNELAPPVDLGVDHVQDPTIVFVGDAFVVAFYTYDVGPGPSIWGATFDENGNLLTGARPITAGDAFVRGHSLLSLGDRVFLTWSGADASGHYDLHAVSLDKKLSPLADRRRLLQTSGHATGTLAVQGGYGEVGVLFDETGTDGRQAASFLMLECRQQSLR